MAASTHRISSESFETLIALMESFMMLSFKFKLALRLVLDETVYEKDATILNFGDTQGAVWFLLDGLFREVRINKMTTRPVTSWFWLPGDFSYTDPGFFSQQPSSRAIHVMERTKVVLISYQDWYDLKKEFREGEILTELLRGGFSKSRVEHLLDMKNGTVDERYLDKEKILDYLFPRTQLNYIADYMGMAPDTLGKLRGKYYGRKG